MVEDNTRKWIVLYDPQEYEIEFYESLNFSIIIADTKELLKYFETIESTTEKTVNNTVKVPSQYQVPSFVEEASYPV